MIASSTVPCLEIKPGITSYARSSSTRRIWVRGPARKRVAHKTISSSVVLNLKGARLRPRRLCALQTSFAGLVVLAEEFYPIPFRTRPSKPPAPMVLRLKSRESRSLPVLLRTSDKASSIERPRQHITKSPAVERRRGFLFCAAKCCLSQHYRLDSPQSSISNSAAEPE